MIVDSRAIRWDDTCLF